MQICDFKIECLHNKSDSFGYYIKFLRLKKKRKEKKSEVNADSKY